MKLAVWIFMIVGVMILLNIAGFNTSAGYVLNYLDIVENPQNLQNSNFYAVIVAIFASAIVGGALVSFFTKSSPESYLIAPLAGILILFLGDILSIVIYTKSLGVPWISYIVLMILAPVAVGYLISVIDWWRGTD